MKLKLIGILIGILTIINSCGANEGVESKPQTIGDSTSTIASLNPVQNQAEIDFSINKTDDSTIDFNVHLTFGRGCWVVSPLSKNYPYGNMVISIDESEYLTLEESIVEHPKSVLEYDTILRQEINFIRENTIFSQKIKLNNLLDFDVSGRVWFILEPICTPYEVKYTISNRAGKLTVKDKQQYPI
ncbi:MAG: hypothetical protein AB8B74_03765 [Crocinitomicaceae bacterium]